MFEVSENECGFDDVADSAGAGGDVLEGAAALGEQGEAVFPHAVQGAQECVSGAGGRLSAGWLTGARMSAPS